MKKTLLALIALILIGGTAKAADWGLNFNFNHPNPYIYIPPAQPVPPPGYYYQPYPYYAPAPPYSFYYRDGGKRPSRDRGRDCRPSKPRQRNPRDCR